MCLTPKAASVSGLWRHFWSPVHHHHQDRPPPLVQLAPPAFHALLVACLPARAGPPEKHRQAVAAFRSVAAAAAAAARRLRTQHRVPPAAAATLLCLSPRQLTVLHLVVSGKMGRRSCGIPRRCFCCFCCCCALRFSRRSGLLLVLLLLVAARGSRVVCSNVLDRCVFGSSPGTFSPGPRMTSQKKGNPPADHPTLCDTATPSRPDRQPRPAAAASPPPDNTRRCPSPATTSLQPSGAAQAWLP